MDQLAKFKHTNISNFTVYITAKTCMILYLTLFLRYGISIMTLRIPRDVTGVYPIHALCSRKCHQISFNICKIGGEYNAVWRRVKS